MSKFHEFTHDSGEKITSVIKDKTISKCELDDIRGDDFLVFHFDDSSVLRIRYDWIYEWQFLDDKNES